MNERRSGWSHPDAALPGGWCGNVRRRHPHSSEADLHRYADAAVHAFLAAYRLDRTLAHLGSDGTTTSNSMADLVLASLWPMS